MTNDEYGNLNFDPRDTLKVGKESYVIYRLDSLEKMGIAKIGRLPFSIRVLLENLLRSSFSGTGTLDDVKRLAAWEHDGKDRKSIPFMPARVVLQDFTGVPAVVDLAAMRSAIARMGGDPSLINSAVPADLVIDHSVQVDYYGTGDAYQLNTKLETERNIERYSTLKWAQKAFTNFRVVPPGTGIVHQVNLEYLGEVVTTRSVNGELSAFPDTLVGTDSHTTMINGLGILGWGVGGIEAEAVLLGQPYFMLIPEVVGMKLTGSLPEGTTSTDLVLYITEFLREAGVVGRFVEFFGPGLSTLSLPDRATISNMSPEYGATMTFFPVDHKTLSYLSQTGRPSSLISMVEKYTVEQRLFHTEDEHEPDFTRAYEFDLSGVEPTLAGPRKPHERVPLDKMKEAFMTNLPEMLGDGITSDADNFTDCGSWTDEGGSSVGAPENCACPAEPRNICCEVPIELSGEKLSVSDGSVVIAAITSCTNTSNPSVMVGAGLLAKKAVEKGLSSRSWVKTSMAPGSKIVTRYLEKSGLISPLEALGFNVVGYGCTTCIGNSGPLHPEILNCIEENQLITAAVLSGNRNYEARINPHIRANYLASPILVVAYALAGKVDMDLMNEPIADDTDGNPVYLRDLWPSEEEISAILAGSLESGMFKSTYDHVFEGDENWDLIEVPEASMYNWNPEATYVQEPPFFQEMPHDPPALPNIKGARVLAIFGDTLTTDHISPAGTIPPDSPAGQYLIGLGIEQEDFNSFGSRRGNHEVMMRGTFGNIRIKNLMVDQVGNWTLHRPSGDLLTIYDAAMRYHEEKTPLVVLGGKEYGAGSSRDWAAKGTSLLGVKAVIAESYERIHRSNLVGMGVLPLQFTNGQGALTLGLDGTETLDIFGIEDLTPDSTISVTALKANGDTANFDAIVRLESEVDLEYYKHGGILNYVLREFLAK